MKPYIKYLWYVIRHKYFVARACFRHGLYWQGLVHDWHKFRPCEFGPYARHFYGSGRNISTGRDKSGYYKPTDTGDKAFDMAWLFHARMGKHHWQFWAMADVAEIKAFDIPDKYVMEMLCDWEGAGKAQGRIVPLKEWYETNSMKMILSPGTRSAIREKLSLFK